MTRYRGKGQQKRPKYCWDKSLGPKQQVIACFHAKPSKEPDWAYVENDCRTHLLDDCCFKDLLIDSRRETYFRVDNNKATLHSVQRSTEKKRKRNISLTVPTAYPSNEFKQAVIQSLGRAYRFTLYQILIKSIPDNLSHGIYIVSEQEDDLSLASAIYIGQTTQFIPRRLQQHKRNENAWFMKYVRYQDKVSANWAVTIFPYEACQPFAVMGQLMPDLEDSQEFQQWLNARYLSDSSRDKQWGLDQAEKALITYCHPHFNQAGNTYAQPLKCTNYCQQMLCSICKKRGACY